MRVALATTHLPLRNVADAITPPLLESVLRDRAYVEYNLGGPGN